MIHRLSTFIANLDLPDRLTFGGIVLQALGFALLPASPAAMGIIVPGLWFTALGIRLGQKGG